MDFSFTDNEKMVIKKTKSISNFWFSKRFFGTSNGPIRRVPEGPGVHLIVVCMDFSFTDNDKEVIKKTKSILNFCFSRTFYGTSKEPIRRVPEGPGVHLVGVCMGRHGFLLYR